MPDDTQIPFFRTSPACTELSSPCQPITRQLFQMQQSGPSNPLNPPKSTPNHWHGCCDVELVNHSLLTP